MLRDKKCMVHLKAWVYSVYVYVCVQLRIHNSLFPPSIWPASTAPYINLDPVHLDIPPPCLHAYTYIHPCLPSPSPPSPTPAAARPALPSSSLVTGVVETGE